MKSESWEGWVAVLERERFGALLDVLRSDGYRLIGPKIKGGSVVLDELGSEAELPEGWTAQSGPGCYRLKPHGQPRLFAYPPEPNGAKSFLFPPRRKLWSSEGSGATIRVEAEPIANVPLALIGLHSCDLRAIAIQDRVFLGGPFVDPAYKAARESAFLIGVNCGGAASTCFCASVGSGPRVSDPHDLSLTEIVDADGHRFIVSSGSEQGSAVMRRLPLEEARRSDLDALDRATANAIRMQERRLETSGLKERLYTGAEHPRWQETATRCLACGNCTSVCPTCFCSTVEDASDLTGAHTHRSRVWDSCFNAEFSYIHGGSVRSSVMSRYRQWLTHKLAAWQDQFGTLGCVGCGRCIAWCPAGIDIVEEANALCGVGVSPAKIPIDTSLTHEQETLPSFAGVMPAPRGG